MLRDDNEFLIEDAKSWLRKFAIGYGINEPYKYFFEEHLRNFTVELLSENRINNYFFKKVILNLSVKYEKIEELFSLQITYSASRKEESLFFKFRNHFLDIELFNFFLRMHRTERIYPSYYERRIFQFDKDSEISPEILGLILLYNIEKEGIKLIKEVSDSFMVTPNHRNI